MSEKTRDFAALKQVLSEILGNIHALSDCQSVGIRVHNNGDYPYYVHKGFPDFFILQENSVCARDDEGSPILDEESNPLLECMCGNVLKGRFDPKFPYFTENGSFWTNSTTQFLATVSDKEKLGRTRDMCQHSGYESVALIPMRAGNRTLGLIQLNDPRENMFTPKDIEKYELIANHVGAVVLNAFEIQERIAAIFDMVNWAKTAED
ncbi:GAF domain-containing protein [Candidatus Bathyarchaeota archaeon]|nr:GAF domain-containing protein [Candidatus Bathyarchaeota archaeon]